MFCSPRVADGQMGTDFCNFVSISWRRLNDWDAKESCGVKVYETLGFSIHLMGISWAQGI